MSPSLVAVLSYMVHNVTKELILSAVSAEILPGIYGVAE